MELFELSGNWILAIGKTIVHSIWIGMLILGLLRLALAYIPAYLSALRHSISVSALLLLFFSVLTAFLLIYEPALSGQESPGIISTITAGKGSMPDPAKDAAYASPGFLFTLFGYIYFAGVLFMLFRSLRSLAYIRGVQKSGTMPLTEWQDRFKKLREGLNIKRSVDFLESGSIKGPLLVTYLKPAVIVPAGMLTNLPVGQIETILLHELYHLKRKDYLINFLQLFIEAVLFYHPVVWLISAYIRSEREYCCDDRVLSSTDNPLNYAKALIRIAEEQNFTRLAPGAVGSEKTQFYSRIKRILNQHTMKTNMRDKVLTLTLLAGSLILLLTISGFSAGPSFIKHNMHSIDMITLHEDPPVTVFPDTIPEESPPAESEELEEIEEAELEAIREEIEEARLEALQEIEEIDWEAMKEEIEEARLEALQEIEEIDWEAMKEEMEEARLEALQEIEEIDWEAMKEEMEEVRMEALQEMEEIDWEAMKEEMAAAREEALKEIEEIDWDELRVDMENSLSEMKLDMEQMRIEIENSMNEIDWDEIKEDMREDLEKARISLDSLLIELDL